MPEFDGQPQPNAIGDDLAGIDDEDGIAFIGGIFPGQISVISRSMFHRVTDTCKGGLIIMPMEILVTQVNRYLLI